MMAKGDVLLIVGSTWGSGKEQMNIVSSARSILRLVIYTLVPTRRGMLEGLDKKTMILSLTCATTRMIRTTWGTSPIYIYFATIVVSVHFHSFWVDMILKVRKSSFEEQTSRKETAVLVNRWVGLGCLTGGVTSECDRTINGLRKLRGPSY
jgi:hypothetical protein